MAELFLKKISSTTLSITITEDKDILDKWKIGDDLLCNIIKPRNLQFHKKMRVLLQTVFDNQDKYDEFEDFYIEMKLKAGYYTEHITTKGNIIYTPKSLSFAKCDEFEAQRIYDKFIDIGIKHFCEGSLREEINNKVLEILSFT